MGYGPWGCEESNTTERLHTAQPITRGNCLTIFFYKGESSLSRVLPLAAPCRRPGTLWARGLWPSSSEKPWFSRVPAPESVGPARQKLETTGQPSELHYSRKCVSALTALTD